MLVLNPRTVTFGDARWENIQAVSLDRVPQRVVEEWSDAGPYAVFADVPEQKLRVTVVQDLAAADLAAPVPGDRGTMAFCTSPAAADQRRQRLSMDAVVLRVTHDLSVKGAPTRTILLAPVSSDGGGDPVSVSEA